METLEEQSLVSTYFSVMKNIHRQQNTQSRIKSVNKNEIVFAAKKAIGHDIQN